MLSGLQGLGFNEISTSSIAHSIHPSEVVEVRTCHIQGKGGWEGGDGDGENNTLRIPSEELQGAASHIQGARWGGGPLGHGEGGRAQKGVTTAHLSNPSEKLEVATCHIQGSPPHPIGHLHPSRQLGGRPDTVLQKVAVA